MNSFAVFTGIAKLNPWPPITIAVLTPTTSPFAITSGPPELPGFNDASVWMTLSISRPFFDLSDRPRALTTPAVTLCCRP